MNEKKSGGKLTQEQIEAMMRGALSAVTAEPEIKPEPKPEPKPPATSGGKLTQDQIQAMMQAAMFAASAPPVEKQPETIEEPETFAEEPAVKEAVQPEPVSEAEPIAEEPVVEETSQPEPVFEAEPEPVTEEPAVEETSQPESEPVADAAPEPEPVPAPAAETAPTGGKLTQEQIEAMLNGGAAAAEPEPTPAPAPAAPSSGGGTLTQEQIEAMLNGGAVAAEPEPEPEPEPVPAPAAESEPTGGKLTQEQIEAMLNGGAAAAEPEPEPEPEPAPAPAAESAPTGGKLTQEQIEAMLNGGADAVEPESAAEAAPEPEPAQKNISPEAKAQDDMLNKRIADMLDDDYDPDSIEDEAAESDDTDQIAEQLKANIEADKPPAEEKPEPVKKKKPGKETDPEKKRQLLAKVFTAASVLVAAVLGFVVALALFSDVMISGSTNFAIKAANSLKSTLPIGTELYVYKSFVKTGSDADECMLYAVTTRASKSVRTIYLVEIAHNSPNVINIYSTIDEQSPEYIAAAQSSDAETAALARRLKDASDSVFAQDRKIQISSPEWQKVDSIVVNRNITAKNNTAGKK